MLSRARIVPVVTVGSSWLVVGFSQLWAALRSDWWVGSALGLFVAVYGLVRWSIRAGLSLWPDGARASPQSDRPKRGGLAGQR
jgi:hypothetical protein